MKILAITQEVGNSAVGIVAERILAELSKTCEVDLIVSTFKPTQEISLSKKESLHHYSIHYKIDGYLFDTFGTDIFSEIIKRRLSVQKDYDWVLSIGANDQYYGLIIARYIHRKYKIKWVNYFVDAIPAPLGWSKNNLHYRRVLNLVKTYLPDVDLLAAVNQEMLEYQKGLFVNKPSMKSVVLLPPAPLSQLEELNPSKDQTYRFVYAGNIYGMRSPQHVVAAFAKLCDEVKNVELIFVGDILYLAELERNKYPQYIQDRIKVCPSTKDLVQYYQQATALIDIDADIENDVFLSSKIAGYLAYNRIIICETGCNSPSRHLFNNLKSVYQCGHDPVELKNAMVNAINESGNMDFTERIKVLESFSAASVVKKLQSLLVE